MELTPKGIEKTDAILEHIITWENNHNMNDDEIKTLKNYYLNF